MALEVFNQAPTLLIRRQAYERLGIGRPAIDERLGLTADEFRVEGSLVVIGPVYDEDAFMRLLYDLENEGLVYFEDYFELSGNWPAWLRIFASASSSPTSQ